MSKSELKDKRNLEEKVREAIVERLIELEKIRKAGENTTKYYNIVIGGSSPMRVLLSEEASLLAIEALITMVATKSGSIKLDGNEDIPDIRIAEWWVEDGYVEKAKKFWQLPAEKKSKED